eukprot:maker-scaffold_50-snap-gene-0.5-mRNA-1 protein AED:0.49 eAED:0.90 QI:0/0/0/1/0/0/2/0/139
MLPCTLLKNLGLASVFAGVSSAPAASSALSNSSPSFFSPSSAASSLFSATSSFLSASSPSPTFLTNPLSISNCTIIILCNEFVSEILVRYNQNTGYCVLNNGIKIQKQLNKLQNIFSLFGRVCLVLYLLEEKKEIAVQN